MKMILLLAGVLLLTACKEESVRPLYSEAEGRAVLENIVTRRSVRKYKKEQVSKDILTDIMSSAMYAPSANNKQPWEVRVVQNQELLNEINQRFINWAQGKKLNGHTGQYNDPGFSIFYDAPTLIVIARDKSNTYSQIDVGIILQNILLSAHALNLGSCPLGAMTPSMNTEANKDILKLLNIPDGYEVTVNVALGYADEHPVAPDRNPDRLKIIE